MEWRILLQQKVAFGQASIKTRYNSLGHNEPYWTNPFGMSKLGPYRYRARDQQLPKAVEEAHCLATVVNIPVLVLLGRFERHTYYVVDILNQ